MDYTIYAGTVRGALACTNCKPEAKAQYEFDPSDSSEITALEWGRTNEIIVGKKSGNVQLYDIVLSSWKKSVLNLQGNGAVVGVGGIENNIVIARSSGHINIWSEKSMNSFKVALDKKSSLDCMAHSKERKNIVATGGENNDLKLWDLDTKNCIFKAKSLRHDKLNLPLPTSIRGITFFQNEENISCCVTKEGYVLLYDERAQRRPVAQFIEPKASYTCISAAYRERQCIVGTTKGYMQLVDLRLPTKCAKTFKSFTGSVTSIVCDPCASIVASTSLDRFLRVHNINTKELMYKEYLKQGLSKLLLRMAIKEEKYEHHVEAEETEELEESDKEYEDMFDAMECIKDTKKQNKRRKSDIADVPKKIKKAKDDL